MSQIPGVNLDLNLPTASPEPMDYSLDTPPVLPQMRDVADGVALRRDVYENVLNAARSIKPVVGKTHTMLLQDVDYADPEMEDDDKRAETEALLDKASVTRRLRGTWNLVDNVSGEVVDSKRQVIANVPHVFRDGSIILRGTRYVAGLQQRLRPGIYVRRRKNGEAEAHVNVKPGSGSAHRYILEPDTGRLLVNFQHSRIPLPSLLEAMGATRKDMEEAWGKEITDLNYAKKDPKALSKMYERIVASKLKDPNDLHNDDAMKAKIAQAMSNMVVDDEVTQRTLGLAEGGKVTPKMILAATKKVLALANEDADQDDRDHPAFATFHDLADLFSERISNDYNRVRQQMLYKIARKGNLKSLPAGWLDKQLNAAVFNSGLVNSIEEINPLETLDRLTRVTRYGEGGIPSSTATPKEARAVNPGQFNFIDPVRTAESLRVGIDVNVASHTKIGRDKKIYAPFIDRQTGQTVYMSPDKVADTVISTGPVSIEGYEQVVDKGRLKMQKAGTARYAVPNFESMFSHLGQLAPMKNTMFPQRTSMASRMIAQALPMEAPETPLVGTSVAGAKGAEGYEQRMGELLGAIRAKDRANVLAVTPDYIELAYVGGQKKKIPLDNYRPTARKSFVHNTPLVKPGDTVNPGQLLAKSNFTDDEGNMALGINARTALMPFGDNWEDAIIISKDLAKRMAVSTAYKHHVDLKDGNIVNKNKFLAVYGNHYDKSILDNIDDDGVIKPGTVVNRNDPLILSLRAKVENSGKVHKRGTPGFSNASIVWEHEHPGVVLHSFKGKNGYNVVVKTTKELEESDKISGRQGNKGTIRILPTEQMPLGEDGEPLEALISPLSVISRGNSSFPFELALGKIAAKKGGRYYMDDLDGADISEFVNNELKNNQMSSMETVRDPATGRKVKVATGRLYLMGLHHLAESKGSGRGIGSYTSTDEPAKGKGKAKRVSTQELFALMSQGGYKFSAEASLLRGRRNDDFWSAYMRGHEIAAPNVNPVYDGFLDRLKGIGINPIRRGTKTQLLAMTDRDVEKLAQGRVVNVPDTVNIHKDLTPIKGGLFDKQIFGDGDKFGMIRLPEPVLNPVFEAPLRKILGVTEKDLRAIMAGDKDLGQYGTGPEALIKRFKETPIEADIEQARKDIAGNKKTARDAAIKRMGYLKAFEKSGIPISDLFVTTVPVIPPRLRPISKLGNKGSVVINDANFLYKELMLAADNLGQMKQYVDKPSVERTAMYDAYKALVGLADPTQYELKKRGVRGLLKSISGDSPKTGYVQRRLLSTNVDNVGRGVLVPDTRLDMNQVGLPITMAMNSFQPYVVRSLVQQGISPVDALEHAKNRSPRAVDALVKIMEQRPVVMSRAPVLHRYGIIGLNAHLVPGSSIKLNPFVYKGLAADNDGDALNFHVPHGKDVVDEIRERLMPDKMLTSQADLKTPGFMPNNDHLLGLYLASSKRKEKGRVRYMKSLADAIGAFKRGELDIDDPVSFTE